MWLVAEVEPKRDTGSEGASSAMGSGATRLCYLLRAAESEAVLVANILGVSGSLRNARVGASSSLCADLAELRNESDLIEFLGRQGSFLVESFLEAHAETESYLEAFDRLRAKSREQGLSNSEAALACGLWSCLKAGCAIDHLSLSRCFPPGGGIKHAAELREKVLACDGLLVSGPVYFGDRGSLVQSFIDFCHQDDEIKAHLQGKVYAGISVGAKRNGGQETSLIYQMLDMANLGLLSVGNDSQTTSQYGGTVVAGDVGKFTLDDYGIQTCLSTGNRIAHVARLNEAASQGVSNHKIKINLLILQDMADRTGLAFFTRWAEKITSEDPSIEVAIWDALEFSIVRCIGCDICPTDVGPTEDYRCIITRQDDFFARHHANIIDADALLVCVYSPEDRKSLISVYQQYMERTRYLRRDNYVYGDLLVAPFVISELSARQNMHMRIMTSMVRHQTIIQHPIIGMLNKGELINRESVWHNSIRFLSMARQIVRGRRFLAQLPSNVYQPIGYVISERKAAMDASSGKAARFSEENLQTAKARLEARTLKD